MVRVVLMNDRHEAGATRNVNPSGLRIQGHVIAAFGDWYAGPLLARLHFQYCQPRRSTQAYETALVGLIQRQGADSPVRSTRIPADDLTAICVDNGDLAAHPRT